MAAPVKNNKARKPVEPIRKIPAWTGARASATFSAGNTPAPSPPPQTKPGPDAAHQRVLQALSGLTGTTITLLTKTSQRYEGVVSTISQGDTLGVTLKDAKELTNPGAPLKESFFIASTNIDTWSSGPADSKAPNGAPDSFQTDTDISRKGPAPRERVLQAWKPDSEAPSETTGKGDDLTFGSSNGKSNWDQFAANEAMYGVKATFDEEQYTTKLDRSAVDFKERERKAQRLANEINSSGTNNPHIAEERNQAGDDSGVNEEDKYGAVVRGSHAYVPPGARRSGPNTPADGPPDLTKPTNGADASKATSPAPSGSTKPPADPIPAFRDFVAGEKQRLTAKKNALQKVEMDKRISDLMQFSQNFKLNKPIPEDLVSILAKDEDKQRAIREKSTKDAASGQARTIGGSSQPAPSAARAAALASQNKQEGTRKPSAPNAVAAKQSVGNASFTVSVSKGVPSATPVGVNAAQVKAGVKAPIPMSIQAIPPFKGSRPARPPVATSRPALNTNGSGSASAAPVSPTTAAANKLNVNASSFRPTPKQQNAPLPAQNTPSGPSATTPSRPQRGSVVENRNASGGENPFFGRPIKKGTGVHVKDDFNPFKHNTVAEASVVAPIWPYSGKLYITMFPPPRQNQVQQPPHMGPPPPHMGGPPGQQPMAPPSYEEDSAQQAAARGYVYAYPTYGYAGQPMMPGMGPPGPPGGYMPGPYMQPMHYPPPNGQPMYGPPMGMPPQGYMQPPHPGQFQPQQGPNGGPRQPQTPIQGHAHPYYHHSPQLQHAGAVPYMMMPPPPGNGGPPPPHPYDGGHA